MERGQTLWRIAKVYGVDLDTLVTINHLADARQLDVGQSVFIPGATQALTIPPPPSMSAAPEASAGPSADLSGPASVVGEEFVWPVRGRVAAFYGTRTSHGSNKGVDIQAPEGTEVRAARSGRIVFRDENLRGFGKTVIVDHGETLSTVYAHLASMTVTAGQVVRQGQVIGLVGSTGRAAAPFLHFEIRRQHRPENPFYYLP